MCARWLARLLFRAFAPPSRPPDFIIGDRYMLRWWLIPRNRFFNIYLHHVLHSDDDRAMHDHPWWSISLCLAGQMRELSARAADAWPDAGVAAGYDPSPPTRLREVRQGDLVFRSARALHRLILSGGEECWTLFLTGPVLRTWGFHCPRGWRSWQEYTKPGSYGQIGRGCE